MTLKDESSPVGFASYMKVETTWRELLRCMGLTEHVNNVVALHFAFEDIKKVVVTVYESDETKLLDDYKERKLPRARGTCCTI